MSTWWYLECASHEPPIRSEDAVEQHTHGLTAIRKAIREAVIDDPRVMTRYESNAARFVLQHPHCALCFVSEYGDMRRAPHGKEVPNERRTD